MSKELNPKTVEKVIRVIIAVLSALLGSLAESATHFINSIF